MSKLSQVLAWFAALSAVAASGFSWLLAIAPTNGGLASYESALEIGMFWPVPLVVIGLLATGALDRARAIARLVRTASFMAVLSCGIYGIHWIN